MRTRVALPLLLQAPLAGCVVEQPGERIGIYEVAGTLVENTCGQSAVPAFDSLAFTAELRSEGTAARWVVNGERPGFEGRFEDGGFRFDAETLSAVGSGTATPTPVVEQPEDYYFPLYNTATASAPACTLSVVERIDGTVRRRELADGGIGGGLDDAGVSDDQSDEADLIADNRIEVSASAGSNCQRVLATQGGPFLALPCTVQYTLRGTLQDD